ncbi:LytTR family DNA-binding domain-containing protein [uncultured Arcticibacterium sp.]|uniref:LytTR family DNA-binding domain-containing protein n=1 Tax=uncultured Arcticibacterium sp. TaxID=2173042 RepID=UPI0030F9158F
MVKALVENPEEVLYLKADTNYTVYNLNNGKKVVSGFTLKIHEERSEYNHFLRINRAYLLNPKFIKEVVSEGANKAVLLVDGTLAKVSRRRFDVLAGL